MCQRIELQLEGQILDRRCKTQGCQLDRFLLCYAGRVASVPDIPEALDEFRDGLSPLLPNLCQIGNPSLSSLRVILNVELFFQLLPYSDQVWTQRSVPSKSWSCERLREEPHS